MKNYYYYSAIRKTIVQFVDVFNDIRIERKDRYGVTTGYKKVPIKFGTKEKTWYWLNQKKDEEMLPMISVILSSVEYAPDRQTNNNKNVGKSSNINTGEILRFLNPVPYNFGFTLSIWSLHMIDVDQILEQILPYFSPTIFIKVDIPELSANFDFKVIFSGCSPDVTESMQDDEIRVLKWNLEFTVQGYLFKPVSDAKIIKKIINKFYTDQYSWSKRFMETEYTSGAGFEAESMYIKGEDPFYDIDVWQSSTLYEIGDVVKPTVSNGFSYMVINMLLPGQSGSIEPYWPDTLETPVEDGYLIWELYKDDEYFKMVKMEIFH